MRKHNIGGAAPHDWPRVRRTALRTTDQRAEPRPAEVLCDIALPLAGFLAVAVSAQFVAQACGG